LASFKRYGKDLADCLIVLAFELVYAFQQCHIESVRAVHIHTGTKPAGGNPCSSPPYRPWQHRAPLSPGYCHEEEEEGKERLEEEEERSSPPSSILGFVAVYIHARSMTKYTYMPTYMKYVT
jgi:hypothetical protein